MKLGAYWKRFGAGSIDGLDMFSGMTTYSTTLLKGQCWARLLRVRKMEFIAWYDGRERLWTVVRLLNLRQSKMEAGQQVRMRVRNLLIVKCVSVIHLFVFRAWCVGLHVYGLCWRHELAEVQLWLALRWISRKWERYFSRHQFRTVYDELKVVVECEITLFQPSSTSVWNSFVSAHGNSHEIVSKLFPGLIAARGYFPTCPVLLSGVAEIILK